jgi:hypothetical protein
MNRQNIEKRKVIDANLKEINNLASVTEGIAGKVKNDRRKDSNMPAAFRSTLLARGTNYGNRKEMIPLANLWVRGTHNIVCIIVLFYYEPLLSSRDVGQHRM